MGILGCVLASSGAIYSNILRGDRSIDRTRARLMIDAAAAGQTASSEGLELRSEWRKVGEGTRSYQFTVTDRTGAVMLEQERILHGSWND